MIWMRTLQQFKIIFIPLSAAAAEKNPLLRIAARCWHNVLVLGQWRGDSLRLRNSEDVSNWTSCARFVS